MAQTMTDERFERSFAQAGGWFILCSLEALIEWNKETYHDKEARAELASKITKKYGRELSTLNYRIKHARKIIKHNRYKEAVEKARDSASINRFHPQASKVAEKLLAKINKGAL